tara:strand:- start:2366 stop:2782 length:417 start_codon:yes stop_codon:yes gene_type:complete
VIELTLPFPPSVNAIYRPSRGRIIHTQKARDYKKLCAVSIKKNRKVLVPGNVSVIFNFYMPDRRKRDINNYYKMICDVLTERNIIEDDAFILQEIATNCGVEKPGRVEIIIAAIENVSAVIDISYDNNVILFPILKKK